MKNFSTVIFSLIIMLSTLFFSISCTSKKDSSNYIKIQSITYSIGETSRTVTSSFYFEYTIEDASEEEYSTASNRGLEYYTYGIIELNGTVKNTGGSYTFNDGLTVEQLKSYIGQSHYFHELAYNPVYKKITYTNLIISYLQFKSISNDTFELKYYSQSEGAFITQEIKSNSYVISYFL